MRNGDLADVTLHVDEDLDPPQRVKMESDLKALDGVVVVHMGQGPAAHLVIVGYDPELTQSEDLISSTTGQGLHASLIGF